MTAIDRSKLRGGSTTLIAQDLSMHVDQLGGKTVNELAMEYGISRSRMRQVLHAARRPLRRKGYVVCVPIRDEGYVLVFTQDLATYLLHYGHRFDAQMTENEKVDLDIRTLNNGVSIMEPFIQAMWDFNEAINDIVLNTP